MTFYDDLEVSTDASPDDIRRAYRRLALQHHPDKNGNSVESTQRFQQVTTAYETLSDTDRRQQYDLQLSGGGLRTEQVDLQHMNEIFQQVFGQMFPMGEGIRINMMPGPIPGLFHHSFVQVHHHQMLQPDIVETVHISLMDVFAKKRKKMTIRRRLLNGQKEAVEIRFTCNQMIQEFEGQGHQMGPGRSQYGKVVIRLNILDQKESETDEGTRYQVMDRVHLYRKMHVSLEQFYRGYIMYKHLDDRMYQFNFNLEELRRQEVKQVVAPGLGLEMDGVQGDLRLEICVDI